MTLDGDVVRGRCGEIAQALDRLARIRDAGRAMFLADGDAKDIACYRLLLAIEAALALCYHVSARRLKLVSEDDAGCFGGLAKGTAPVAVAQLREVTPRVAADYAKMSQRTFVRDVLKLQRDGLVTIDADGRVSANKSVIQAFLPIRRDGARRDGAESASRTS